MNRISSLLSAFLLLAFGAAAQKAYFQQEVNYKIDVVLNDTAHLLDGHITMEYINHSPDALAQIYMHLWPNAYKNQSSAFADQQLRHRNSRFFFAKDSHLGFLSDLDFMVDGKAVEWQYDAEHPDIALLQLARPLPSSGRIHISTPFSMKIPHSFSRLGHVGQSYQMTQWYPKPAVYDQDGWHPMPYLDMGEFYSEFGSFDVSITLPANYVVAATGVLQTKSERAFLQQKIEETNKRIERSFPKEADFPPSSNQTKTIRYTAEQVHDFAWFADKRFHVQKSQVPLKSGKSVDTWAFFTNEEADLWKKGTKYLDRAVQFYSQHVGEYPWPHATAVQSALSAGGGMEYPMITVIGRSGSAQSLDVVITHEVGHNWFYGILAFNERIHPWMDEGINSYYDHRYTKKYYSAQNFDVLPKIMTNKTDMDLFEAAYLYQARRNLDQAPETESDGFSRINYFLGAYEKPAKIFHWLANYLGQEEFDRIIHSFYDNWKFKHPRPVDFRQHFESHCKQPLDWFFDGLVNANSKTDYAISSAKNTQDGMLMTLINKGEVAAPFPVSALKNGEIVATRWVDGFENTHQFNFPAGDYDKLVVDAQKLTLDYRRHNNTIKLKGILKKLEPLQLKFLGGLDHSQRSTLYWSPLVGYNAYDELMAGVAVYNTALLAKRFEFALAPLYGFGSKDLAGLGHLRWNSFPDKPGLERVRIGLSAKQFNFNYNDLHDYYQQYRRVVPSVRMDFRKSPPSQLSQRLDARAILLTEDIAQFSIEGEFLGTKGDRSQIYQLAYTADMERVVNPFSLRLTLEQQSYGPSGSKEHYLKAGATLNTAYTYKRNRHIKFRIFAGAFLDNSRRDAGSVASRSIARGSFGLSHQGFNDYTYDNFFFGRSEPDGFWSQQINLREGGMKFAPGSPFKNTIGHSNSYIFSLNMKADLPAKLPLNIPLKPYFDIGFYKDAMPLNGGLLNFSDQLVWSGGLMLEWLDGALGVYFPLINSDNLKSVYDQIGNGYGGRITYSLDLNALDPWEAINRLNF